MNKSNIFRAIIVFFLFFCIFLTIHLHIKGLFGTDDPYYHVKHSWLIEQTGNINLVEPWLEFHFFNTAPTDPWWGYHLVLAVFIHFFGPFLGAKILTGILAALVFTVYYFILSDFKIRRPLVWTLLFYVSSVTFQFRLLFERPFTIAIILSPLIYWLILRKKHLLVFIASFFFALFYNLAPLAIFMAFVFLAAEYYFHKKLDFRPIVAVCGGILAGIAAHPSSMNYVSVIFVHIFKVLALKFAGIDLGIGSEVQTIDFFKTISSSFIVFAMFVVALAMFIEFASVRKNSNKFGGGFLAVFSFLWLFVTLLVPRGVEYWLPFAWIFIAVTFDSFFRTDEFVSVKDSVIKHVNAKILLFFCLSFVFIMALYNFFQIMGGVYDRNNDKTDYYFQEANEWLKGNTPENSVVFYDDWSYWPLMFFYNHHNRYIAGMDPTFLYQHDKELFWSWRNIGLMGMDCVDEGCTGVNPKEGLRATKPALMEKFGAGHILIEKEDDTPFLKLLNGFDHEYLKVFENEKLIIFKVI